MGATSEVIVEVRKLLVTTTPALAEVVPVGEKICFSSLTQAALVAMNKHIAALKPVAGSASLG